VGVADGVDFYKFTATQPSEFTAVISGNTSPIRMTLLQDKDNNGVVDNNEELANNGFNYNSSVSLTLGAGTYYVKVATANSGESTNYILYLTA